MVSHGWAPNISRAVTYITVHYIYQPSVHNKVDMHAYVKGTMMSLPLQIKPNLNQKLAWRMEEAPGEKAINRKGAKH